MRRRACRPQSTIPSAAVRSAVWKRGPSKANSVAGMHSGLMFEPAMRRYCTTPAKAVAWPWWMPVVSSSTTCSTRAAPSSVVVRAHGGAHRPQVDLARGRGLRRAEQCQPARRRGECRPDRRRRPCGGVAGVHRGLQRAGVQRREERVDRAVLGQLHGLQRQSADEPQQLVVAVEVGRPPWPSRRSPGRPWAPGPVGRRRHAARRDRRGCSAAGPTASAGSSAPSCCPPRSPPPARHPAPPGPTG